MRIGVMLVGVCDLVVNVLVPVPDSGLVVALTMIMPVVLVVRVPMVVLEVFVRVLV